MQLWYIKQMPTGCGFICQQEYNFQGSYVLAADYTNRIESHQFQCIMILAACLKDAWSIYPRMLRKQCPALKKDRETLQLPSTRWEEPGQNRSMSGPYRTSKPSILKQLSGLTKDTTSLLTMFSLRLDSDSLVSQPIMLVCYQTIQFFVVWEYFGHNWLLLWGQCIYKSTICFYNCQVVAF